HEVHQHAEHALVPARERGTDDGLHALAVALHALERAALRLQSVRVVSRRQLRRAGLGRARARGLDAQAGVLDGAAAGPDPARELLEPVREQVALILQIGQLVGGLLELDGEALEPAAQLRGLRVRRERVTLELRAAAGDVALARLDLVQRFARAG